MRVLGVDPGLAITGYGVIEENESSIDLLKSGVVKTSTRDPLEGRLETIYRGLEELIREYRPEVLVLEELYSHYKHPTTAIMMGHARGIICLLCGVYKLTLVNLPSTVLKKSIVGYGRASKLQVQRMVQGLLNLKDPPKSIDAADALALALSYVYSLREG